MEILKNRWFIVLGALAIQLCLGALYSWSVFVNPLKSGFSFSTTETQAIFSVALATFAVVMVFAGRWQDRIGPRKVSILGGILLGLGYVLAGLTGGSFPALLLTVGIMAGAGIGLSYVCPLATLIKWFPDKRGLISGLAVAGFGAGAWIFAQVATVVIESAGVLSAFTNLGIIFGIAVVLGSLVLRNPPKGWSPAGWKGETKNKTSGRNFDWREIIKTKDFWFLWIMFMFSAAAGLMVIGNLKPFGVFSGLSAAIAGSAVGILALFNGAGRIVWGSVSDRIGRSKSMALMFALQGVMMLILLQMGQSPLLLAVAAAWVGFNFGGNFALFPSVTADYFGTKHVGVNYGLVFTAYGVAGVIGPILGGSVFDLTGSYSWAFIPSGIACLVAAAIAFLMKVPEKK
ncbi:MAG: OFA family MFS transporter [Candidatus Micrarchaeota archaeon]|nr:OFA family MFS transporter [Candidatus Micrarchaeota archaeon]